MFGHIMVCYWSGFVERLEFRACWGDYKSGHCKGLGLRVVRATVRVSGILGCRRDCLLHVSYREFNIRALIVNYSMLGVPYWNNGILYPKPYSDY